MSAEGVEIKFQASVAGEPYSNIPADLFIPPDALEVLLDSFTGPLDLLLYLIRRQNIDIMDIPIVTVTRQYVEYVELMKTRHLELAADYLVMAAVLAEIKSRMLLPKIVSHEGSEEEEADPRMALVRKLQQYEQFKQAANTIDEFIQWERDVFPIHTDLFEIDMQPPLPEVSCEALLAAMQSLLIESGHRESHAVQQEQLSVRDRMNLILQKIANGQTLELTQLFVGHEGRMGLVVSLLAILELAKQTLLTITQVALYESIYVKGTHHQN